MEKFVYIILLIGICLERVFVYLSKRNDEVLQFKNEINALCYRKMEEYTSYFSDKEYNEKEHNVHEDIKKMWNSINDIPYYKMLFSFKPLKVKYWFTKEQQEFLK